MYFEIDLPLRGMMKGSFAFQDTGVPGNRLNEAKFVRVLE
jgi:hypothetical protein